MVRLKVVRVVIDERDEGQNKNKKLANVYNSPNTKI